MVSEELKNELVELYKLFGVEEDEAVRRIDMKATSLLKDNPSLKLEQIYAKIRSALINKINVMKRTGAKPMTFVVVGYGEYRNYNDRRIKEAMAQGRVREIDGEVVAVDDNGRPIRENWVRPLYVFLDGYSGLFTAYVDMEDTPIVGASYTGFCRVNEGNKTISIVRDIPISLKENLYGTSGLWEMALKNLDDILCPVDLVEEAYSAGARFVALKGFVSTPISTQREDTYMVYVNSIDFEKYVQTFIPADFVPSFRECEMLVLGRLTTNTVGKLVLNAVGFVVNPDTLIDKEMEEKILEGLF